MNYREYWFANNPSKDGYYKCVRCHKKFKKADIDIDHIIPQNKGGTDKLSNLQPMCKHCNRSKQDSTDRTVGDYIKNAMRNAIKPNKVTITEKVNPITKTKTIIKTTPTSKTKTVITTNPSTKKKKRRTTTTPR